MTSCIEEILCIFSKDYDDYLSAFCEQSNLIVDLLKEAQPEFPSEYISGNCIDSKMIIKAEEELVKVTQEKFRARQSGEERSESLVPTWITRDVAAIIIDNFKKLNFISAKNPKLHQYQCAALLGSTAPNIEERFVYLVELINDYGVEIEKLFLLTGTRAVDSNKYNDGPEEYIESVRKKYNVEIVTEKELIQDKYYSVCKINNKCSQVEMIPVIAEKDEKKEGRATTVDTLNKFQDFAKNCNQVLYISVAPFIVYQNEIIGKFFKNNMQHKYETVGKNANLNVGFNSQKIAHYMVMAFAEALFSADKRIKESINTAYDLEKDEL
ncbi:hypothetical protein [Candidatus Aquarickettsia rohweri]|uniref:Uncharacterized protein n=1 Tax=Candidatus Aquarickettsia rohweri TaxID=2602574 RepID=A0A3S0FT16_9RICK|nr:hypothetical protein [Candidatus Aquarickettsia rohweri]RST70333.1 hypothetical protein EIC27_01405 [Candidatus Aquarickettsia rohweri]